MRRWMAAPLLVTAVAVLCYAPPTPVYAQNNAPEEETFQTADGIQLHGLFHKSEKSPGTDPVVILMYPPGKDENMLKGDWKGLAERLTKEGYNVFRFDWRGHGKSSDLKNRDRFWTNPFTGPWNSAFIYSKNENKEDKETFYFKDFKDSKSKPIASVPYMPVYLNDLAAVRAHLDSKNDAGDCNTSSIYLIGSDSAAALGIAWMAAEWNRPAFYPTLAQLTLPNYVFVPQPIRGDFDTAGSDISGAVWLTPDRGGTSEVSSPFTKEIIKSLVTGIQSTGLRLPLAPKTRENIPMLFLFGKADTKGESSAKFFNDEVLVAKGGGRFRPLDSKLFQPLAGAGKLRGVSLLGDDDKRGTETNIVKFLAKQQAERKSITRKPRGYNSPYYIRLDSFGFVFPRG